MPNRHRRVHADPHAKRPRAPAKVNILADNLGRPAKQQLARGRGALHVQDAAPRDQGESEPAMLDVDRAARGYR
jgi:hypothetical protein